MLHQPKFKNCFHVEVIPSIGVFLLSESDYFVLTGQLYEYLALLIDGDRTVDEIVNLLQDRSSTAEIYYGLMLMEQKGYIVENSDRLSSETAAFWELLNLDPIEATEKFSARKVAIEAFGNVPRQAFTDLLRSCSISVADEAEITVVLTDNYLHPDLDRLNREALASQRPWMLVKPIGKEIWIGPIFSPGGTACWECLAQRLRSNRPVETFIQKQKHISTAFATSVAFLPSTLQTGLNLAATEIAKWLVRGENRTLENNLVTFDTLSLQMQHHPIVKRPQCAACGELSQQKPLPVLLQSRQKTFTADNGHRCASPEETLKRYQHHISPITGAVRGLQLISSPNGLTHTYVAGHNFATMFDNLYFLRQNLRGKSGGKGKTDAQAKASALCEAIERYSGIFQGDEIREKGSYQKMGDRAIHPNVCMLFSDRQYETRQQWNSQCPSFFHRVPEPFDEEREIDWTPVWSLTHQEFKYLPTAYCYYGYPKPNNPDCWADSNGTAAGNTKEEAILQGFMELVERDAVAVWWYNRLQRPTVDLESFDQPYFRSLKHYYDSIDRDLWILDLTSDLNIPTFGGFSRRRNCEVEDIIFGFGSHFDPVIAITRALTELNQVLPAVITIAEDGTTRYSVDDPLTLDWFQSATLENQPYLVPDDKVAAKTYLDYPQFHSDDLREDVMVCNAIAAKNGMEMLVLDQTRPDIELNVVKVLVPGMRHFWKRWAAGRLYDVPVKLGQLSASLSEDRLNPFPIFF